MAQGVVGKNGILFGSEEARELYEGASMRLGWSVIDIVHFVWDELLNGKTYLVTKQPKSTLSNEVPAPDEEVDLALIWQQMASDDNACAWIMSHEPSISDVLRVMANQLSWLRFGAVRWPTADGRKAFHALCELQHVAIRSLIAKGRTQRGAQEVNAALAAMLVEPVVQ
jgi:hypothetical protein